MNKYIKIGLISVLSTGGCFLVYFLIEKYKRKSRTSNLTTPFSIKTTGHKYIGLTKETEENWNGSFQFIQAADTQFGLIDRYILKKQKITWTREIELLRLLIKSVNILNPKPKFFVICGDLVDAFPTEIALRKSQVTDLKIVLRELDPEISVVCVCGNHDIGDVPTEDGIQSYRRDFGDDFFSFWFGGCKFITLNSQYFYNATNVPQIKEEQERWLDEELQKDKWKHLVVFQHIPWFLHRPNEAEHDYFNIEPKQRYKWLEKFKEAGVGKIFCGHYHQNAGGWYENVEVVVTSAVGAQLGADKHGYRLVTVNEDKIEHKYISITDTVN